MKRIHILMFPLLSTMLFFLLPKTNLAQISGDSNMIVQSFVTEHGFIKKYNHRIGYLDDPANFITIYSSLNKVYSICNGRVKAIVKSNDGYMILIKKYDSVFVFANLKKPLLKKGDTILKGEKIGEISEFNGISYELKFGISILPKLRDLNYIQLQKYLTLKDN